MTTPANPAHDPGVSRRQFVVTSGAFAAAALAGGCASESTPAQSSAAKPASTAAAAGPRRAGRLKVGVIGCGGRGSGAAVNILEASPDTEIHALGDVFMDRVEECRSEFAKQPPQIVERAAISPGNVFVGFDAYKKVIATDVDIVILATPPHFRPIHFAAAVERGKHVFMEKPVAVDPTGIRSVMESGRKAAAKNLSVVAGTQRRHEVCYNEARRRIQDGAIGKVVSAAVYWNMGGLWMNQRKPEWSDMEWQLRNWLYFTWLSGDHICEQHVHNLDIASWYMGPPPIQCQGMGGRQVRTSPEYGHVFDHFACEFTYADGRRVTSYCRQIDGCAGRVEEVIYGADGYASLAQFGHAQIFGKSPWKWTGEQTPPYTQEQKDLVASIQGRGPYLNHAQRIAESTLLAIMGRMSAYTGKTVSWEQALNSRLDLSPPAYEMGSLSVPEVAVPGRTPLI